MDFIRQINAFHDSIVFSQLSPGQIALWYALTNLNNRTYWKEWFSVASQTISSLTGLSRSGILRDRNILMQKGYIEFRTRGTRATLYRVLPLFDTAKRKQECTQEATQRSEREETRDGGQKRTPFIEKDKNKNENGVLSEESTAHARFIRPTREEVEAFIRGNGYPVDPVRFFSYYESNGWHVGRCPMEDWRAAVRSWAAGARDRRTEREAEDPWTALGRELGIGADEEPGAAWGAYEGGRGA